MLSYKSKKHFSQDIEQTQNTSTRPVCCDLDLNMKLLKHLLYTLSNAKIPLWVQAIQSRHEAVTVSCIPRPKSVTTISLSEQW